MKKYNEQNVLRIFGNAWVRCLAIEKQIKKGIPLKPLIHKGIMSSLISEGTFGEDADKVFDMYREWLNKKEKEGVMY